MLGRRKGREVDIPPVCVACSVGLEGEDLVQSGLKRTEKVDGGLGRVRWELGQRKTGNLVTAPASIRSVSRDSLSLRRAGEGSRGDEQRPVPLDSTIYVSVNDPLEEETFKPSPTKPIPTWMQPYQPVDQVEERPVVNGPLQSLVGFAQTPETSVSGGSTVGTMGSPTPTYQPATPQSFSPCPSPMSLRMWPPDQRRTQAPTWVSNEPLKRPSSRLGARLGDRLEKTDTTTSSGYVTPPETPGEREARHMTPPPQLRRVRPRSPLVPPDRGRRAVRLVRRTPPPQSSEYLELYNPIRSPSPRPRARESAMVALRRVSRTANSLGHLREAPETGIDRGRDQRDMERMTADGADSPREGTRKKMAWRRVFGGAK